MACKDSKSIKPSFLTFVPRILGLMCLCVLLFSFNSCRTMSGVPAAFKEDATHAPLESGAVVYIFANVKEARSIIDLLPIEELNDKYTKQMLDKTNYITAALFPQKSGRRFHLAAWGKYPSNADMAFSMNKEWKKIRSTSNYTYWHSERGRLSILMNSKQAFVAASLTSAPLEPLPSPPGAEIPEGFNEFRQNNNPQPSISFWMDNPGSAISGILSAAGIPIRFPVQKLFLSLVSKEKKYIANINFQFENVSQARGVTALLSIAAGYMPNDPIASIFLANPPVQNGRNVMLKTAALDEKELSLLLTMFSLY